MIGRIHLVDIAGDILHQTDQAILFQAEDKVKSVWLPLSQIDINDSIITMPEWLAIEKELI